MHHWTVSTSIEFYKVPALNHIWQTAFPQVGFRYPFVARALLSLAALHLAHLNSHKDGPYILNAIRLHDEALEGFQAAVSHITEENSEALLVWSILNVIYVFGVSKHHNDNNMSKFQDPYRDRVLGMELIPMMRGIEAVLAPTHEFLVQGRMDGLMSVGNWFELDPDQQTLLPGSVDDDFCRTRESWAESGDATTYEASLQVLRKCVMFMDQFASMDQTELQEWGCNRAWAGPLMFIFFAPERYFTLLYQRQPAALILYAHFGSLLHRLNGHWFLEGWGRDIVEVVNDLVGSYWRPWIRWPLKVTAAS
ncbi:hypothetical protein B0I35DRAFT_495781 [Stachybotrys elegans]|uniref:Uncharacterized protein n=1 Tax=Stachybotrys elegans TaxID=80388 RepID=A0A8K0SE75_9HYPO|nr:hypothetical protein B0I35DRAFT_495781 [Stachybotrys elegans]